MSHYEKGELFIYPTSMRQVHKMSYQELDFQEDFNEKSRETNKLY